MARNKFVGIGGLDIGLKLVPIGDRTQYAEIPVNEFGLQEVTFRFATFDPGQFRPARGTKCTDFITADAKTAEIMALFPYLACQTSKIIARGHGVHYIDVTCQGAIFDYVPAPRPVASVGVVQRGKYTSPPDIVFSGGGEVTPANAVARFRVKTVTIVSGGTGYIGGNPISILGGSFDQQAELVVQTVGGGGVITSVAVIVFGDYTVLPSNPVTVSFGSATFTITWELLSVEILDGGYYSGTPTAVVDGGTFTEAAVLGAVRMTGLDFTGITRPFDPVTTVKDTSEFTVYDGNSPQYKVTIDYRAMEVSFEYMAQEFVDEPRFLQGLYTFDTDGNIVIDTTGRNMKLQIDSIRAIAQIAELDANSNVVVKDGPEIRPHPQLFYDVGS